MKWFVTLLAVGVLCIPAGAAVTINEIRIDQPSTDNDEYFELAGDASETLDGLTYLVIGDGSSEAGSGVIEAVVELTGYSIPADGYFLVAEDDDTFGAPADLEATLNFENDDNVTHMLVSGFTGALDDDLDPDDDGDFDVTPWTGIVDMIALVKNLDEPPSGTEWWYGTDTLGPDGSYVPGHAFRYVNGTGDWYIGEFDPAGGADTPGTANGPPAPTAVGGAERVIKGATDVPVNLQASGGIGALTYQVLNALPAEYGTLSDDDGPVGPTYPHPIVGTLTYNPPGEPPDPTFTGTAKVDFDAVASEVPSNAAVHYVCVQDTTVVISEIMHYPSGGDDLYGYIEVFNTGESDVNLWALAGNLIDSEETPEVSGNLVGETIPAGEMKIITAAPEEDREYFRCEWALREEEIISVDDDTWERIEAYTPSLVALYAEGTPPALLDVVWVGEGMPEFESGDIGRSLVYDFFLDLTTETNDPGFRWKFAGTPEDDPSKYTTEDDHVRSAVSDDLGSPGYIRDHNPGYEPGPPCGFACCLSDGTCEMCEEEVCLAACGEWHFNQDCDEVTCDVQDQRACCLPIGQCVVEYQCECEQILGGTWYPEAEDCTGIECPVTETLIISEIVDGDLPGGEPKWVEITNCGDSAASLGFYTIARFNNGSTSVTGSTALDAASLEAGDSWVFLYDEDTVTFEQAYGAGVLPDQVGEGPQINGNDVVALFYGPADDSLVGLVDIYGRIDECTGTGDYSMDWAYEDSYAYRLPDEGPAITFDPLEWFIAGNGALDAPTDPERIQLLQDYTTPGTHACTVEPSAVRNCHWHGAYYGCQDLTTVNIEPRAAGIETLEVDFSADLTGGTVGAALECWDAIGPVTYTGTMTVDSPAGAMVTVHFDDPPLPDETCCRVTFSGDASGSVEVRSLAGDLNTSNLVEIGDRDAVKNAIGQAIDLSNFTKDQNANGVIEVGDMDSILNKIGHIAPDCP